MSTLDTYLTRHAEPEAASALRFLEDLKTASWNRVVVVPALAESDLVGGLIESLAHAAFQPALLVLVVNAAEDRPELDHEDNQKLLSWLRHPTGQAFSLIQISTHLHGLVVDRASPGRRLPVGEGVGLARKIGTDIAAALIHRGLVQDTWIRNTDADARVAPDYLDTGPREANVAIGGLESKRRDVILSPFLHRIDPERDLPHTLYELSLHYYVLGLRWAGSPYAFHSLGSTLGFTAEVYAEARGFPKRLAAEDFHFLSKLAKISSVVRGQSCVELIPRASTRVPFGTGAGTARLEDQLREGNALKLYHPDVFQCLSLWLSAVTSFATHRDLDRLKESLSEPVSAIAEELGAFFALEQARDTRPDRRSLLRHFHTWFDALKTLRFVHTARDRFWPSLRWDESLRLCEFARSPSDQPDEALDSLRTKVAQDSQELALVL